jgi:squalene-hopene/tetraprenyl-beta-curcumene cyclase
MRRREFSASLAVLSSAAIVGPLHAADDDSKTYERMVSKGLAYLEKTQASDGSWTAAAGPGITALIATAILRQGRSPDDPLSAKSLKYLESFVQSDGGIYKSNSRLVNYETCLGMVCFKEANKDGRYDKVLKAAEKYIKQNQTGSADGKEQADFEYGGVGYSGAGRPDLSNTQFFLEAVGATGDDASSDAVKRALVFVSRCQNLETEHNTTPNAAKNPDGGFYYDLKSGGEAGKTDEGGLRSYGSMTYAGLKSMIFAGLKKDDPRVKAAIKWVQKNYDLKQNPGVGDSGLFYYYHTLAKALDAFGQDEIEDAKGKKHAWRKELITELASRQKENGSWVNENKKWNEGDANMVTGFALLTLSYCKGSR